MDETRAHNNFELTESEIKRYVEEYTNDNGGARPKLTPEFIERIRIRNLVHLSEGTDYICDACNPKKHIYHTRKRAAKVRQKHFSPWNFAVPPPPFECETKMSPEDAYVTSRATVVMRISNRHNNPEPKCQSKRTGHAAILPLDHAQTMADFFNTTSLPRKRDSLVYLRGVQETKNDPYIIKLQPNLIQEVLKKRKNHNKQYHNINIDLDAIQDFHDSHGIVELKAPDNYFSDDDSSSDDESISEISEIEHFDDPEENEQNFTVRGSSHHGLTDGVKPVHTEKELRELADEKDNFLLTIGVVLQPNPKRQAKLTQEAIDEVCDKLDDMTDVSDSDSDDTECDIYVSKDGTISASDVDSSSDDESSSDSNIESNDRCIGEVRFPHETVKPADEFQREVAWMAQAFPHLFLFGVCAYNNPNRPHKIDDFPAYIVHLMKLSYKRPNGKIVNPFQEATFVHYCHNRMQRHRLSKRFYCYLQKSTYDELRSSDFTVGHLRKLGPKKIAQYVKHAIVRVKAIEGDPAHLSRIASDFRSFTYEYESASEFSTTAFNDHNIMKLHKAEILNYEDDKNGDEARKRITDRRRMARQNPATVSFWLFLKQLLRRDIISRHNYPISYVKWFLAKYEDQFRGTIHEHILQKLVFLFLNKVGFDDWNKSTDKKNFKWEKHHFDQIDMHAPKLAYYSSNAKLAELIITRLLQRCQKFENDSTGEEKQNFSKICSIIK